MPSFLFRFLGAVPVLKFPSPIAYAIAMAFLGSQLAGCLYLKNGSTQQVDFQSEPGRGAGGGQWTTVWCDADHCDALAMRKLRSDGAEGRLPA